MAQTLTEFGSDDFIVDPFSVNNLTVLGQTTSTITVTIAEVGIFGGYFIPASFDWSAIPTTDFGLLMSVPASNPLQNFTVNFYNSNITNVAPANYAVARFTGTTDGVSSLLSALAMTKVAWGDPLGGSGGLDDFTDVAAMEFTWDNPVTVGTSTQATLGGIVVVPESSTSALFLLGLMLCGGLALLKRRRAASRP